MRIAFSTLGRISIENMQRALSDVVLVRQQVATGKKFQIPSQDPIGAQRSISLSHELANLDQYKDSAQGALLFIDSTQAVLLDLGERLREAKSIGLSQRNATADSGTREATAVAVRSIRDQIVTLLNTQVRGRYLFGGHLTTSVPFAVGPAGNVEYYGDDGEITFQTGPSQFEITNVPGSEVAGGDFSFLLSSADLSPVVNGSTALASLNRGFGVVDGQFQIAVGSGGTMTVDTTGLTTVQDVIDQINAGGIGVVAGINPAQDGIRLIAVNPGDTVTVTELNNGTTASELGLSGTGVGTLNGGDLNPRLELTTPLTDIPALTTLPLGAIRIQVDGSTIITSFSSPPPATTIGEVISRFNLAVSELTMSLSTDMTTIQVTGTDAFTIENIGTDTTAQQLGIAGASQQARLFGSLEALEQALLADDGDGIEAATKEIEFVIDETIRLQGVVASRLRRIDIGINMLDTFHLHTETRLADVQSADMAEAVTNLSEAQALYQTALGTAAMIFDFNLFDYLYP